MVLENSLQTNSENGTVWEKLVGPDKSVKVDENSMRNEALIKIMNLFGIRPSVWRRRSKFFTEQDLAQKLVKKSIVSNLEEGLDLTRTILNKEYRSDWPYFYKCNEYNNTEGNNKKYRLEPTGVPI